MRLALVIALLAPVLASAQDAITCTAGCPIRYYFERVVTASCAGLSCTRAVPVAADFAGGTKGLGLSQMRGAELTVCAEPGYLLDGTGFIRLWKWTPWPSVAQ